MTESAAARTAPPWLHRFAVLTSVATFALIFAGGLVTSTGSALAVPDWPLSFGQLFPRMEGGVLFEHGHRLLAGTVAILTAVLCAWLIRKEPRVWVRRLGVAALLAVVAQAVLGGIHVLERLPVATGIAHAALAQFFMCLTVVLAMVTGPRWREAWPMAGDPRAGATRRLLVATVLAIYLQILVGALVRHTGSGLVIPTFPLANGHLWPPIDSKYVAYQMAHRVGALVVAVLVLWSAARVLRHHGATPRLRRPAVLLATLLVWQILLGALTIWKQKAVIPTTSHVLSGALLLATALVLAIRAHRILIPVPAPAGAASLAAAA